MKEQAIIAPARCAQCTRELASDAVVCPGCNSLVHSDELERLAESARQLEAAGKLRPARDEWLRALKLLPQDSEQAKWIAAHAKALLDRALDSELATKPTSKWAKRLAPLGPVGVLLAKSQAVFVAIFKLKFLLTFATFLWVDWQLFGMWFGTGLTVLILIHELGHYIDVKRRGLPAEMPVFLPGFGAYVRWNALGVSKETRAAVSLAGPLAGWLGAAVCMVIWWKTGQNVWAALARASAVLNVLNLVPVWVLDGSQAMPALAKSERIFLLIASLAVWALAGEGIFFVVAAGITYRLFTKDMPEKPSLAITSYYTAVLACLGLVLHFLPGHGFGIQ